MDSLQAGQLPQEVKHADESVVMPIKRPTKSARLAFRANRVEYPLSASGQPWVPQCSLEICDGFLWSSGIAQEYSILQTRQGIAHIGTERAQKESISLRTTS